jgi:flagellar protein FliS
MSASPVELRLMLVDGAIRFAEQCRGGLEQKNFEQAYEGSRQCRAILTELLSGLKPDQDPLLCERLNSLYTFLISRMMEAMSERDPEPILGVIELLRFERETWQMVIEQLADGTAESADSTGTTADSDRPASSGTARKVGDDPAMVGGRLHLAG